MWIRNRSDPDLFGSVDPDFIDQDPNTINLDPNHWLLGLEGFFSCPCEVIYLKSCRRDTYFSKYWGRGVYSLGENRKGEK